MKKFSLRGTEISLKIAAVAIAAMILTSSTAAIGVRTKACLESESDSALVNQSYQTRPCEVSSVLTQAGEWVSYDSSAPGTPAEAHVLISDTSGITIVADFYGFYRNNLTNNGTVYDDLEMPGASPTQTPGTPMVPCLFEYVEIPHGVNVSVEVIESSSDYTTGYNITPTPPPQIPYAFGEPNVNATLNTALPTFFGSTYSSDAFFPGNITGTEGESNTSTMVMRGHRLLGLSFYPVQFNPVNTTLLLYSQLVVKVKYSSLAQIQPNKESLRSEVFHRILSNTILNYNPCNSSYTTLTSFAATTTALAQGSQDGAEYLIITNRTFTAQANRLANWKERKGVPSAVEFVPDGATQEELRNSVKQIVADAYSDWSPVPTYVVLLGDVDVIPANYDVDFTGDIAFCTRLFLDTSLVHGNIASDLGYFNVDPHGYIPDMIYGRISVDTVEQAETIIDKILQYEQSPPVDPYFYNNMLTAGYFQDTSWRNGVEDDRFPFIYTLERIRHYLKDEFGYNIHINYSCAWEAYDSEYWEASGTIALRGLEFQNELTATGSSLVIDSLPEYMVDSLPHYWLKGYDGPSPIYYDDARKNITANFNDGRFLMLYFGHGGSKNMIYPGNFVYPTTPESYVPREERDLTEGWHQPYYNTSYFSDLTNGDQTPFIVSMACSSGWFDGETDEGYLALLGMGTPNPFEDCENDCFAENITRLANGGAIATIAPSRPAFALISGHLLDGIVRALYPGHLETDSDGRNQPIYEMGAALLYGKLYAKKNFVIPVCIPNPFCILNPCPQPVKSTFQEYHLFGDPETKLWTDTPRWINVSYPPSVGTSIPQKFVVTVIDYLTGNPVKSAKVCIQQGDDVYEVRYTDPNGQAIFDVHPIANPSHINVTVTKHNVRPHIGSINVVNSEASISVSPDPVFGDDILTIGFTGFPEDAYLSVYANGYLLAANLTPGTIEYLWQVWSGPTRFLNVWTVVSWGGSVSVNRFQRVASDEGPDPYIYSQDDPSTWDGRGLVWDNPDIIIKRGGVQVYSLDQNEVHDVEVMVNNRGIIPANPTTVTLWYAPFIGSESWTHVGEYTVAATEVMSDTAYFTLAPPVPHSACLKVVLYHPEEREANYINNIGYECIDVIELSSPGEGSLQVGNPTVSADYVFLNVKQLGDHDDIWNATILGYSYQAMGVGASENVTLYVDPISDIGAGEWRLFTVESCVNNKRVGGIVFNVTAVAQPSPFPVGDMILWILMIGGGIAVIVICLVKVRKK